MDGEAERQVPETQASAGGDQRRRVAPHPLANSMGDIILSSAYSDSNEDEDEDDDFGEICSASSLDFDDNVESLSELSDTESEATIRAQYDDDEDDAGLFGDRPVRTLQMASQDERDIWNEMEQNERLEHITSQLSTIGLIEGEIQDLDEIDVEVQMAIEDSVRQNLDVVADFLASESPLPAYSAATDAPAVQTSSLVPERFIVNPAPQDLGPSRAADAKAPQLPASPTRSNARPEMQNVAGPSAESFRLTMIEAPPPAYCDLSDTEWNVWDDGAQSSEDETGVMSVPETPPPSYPRGQAIDEFDEFLLL